MRTSAKKGQFATACTLVVALGVAVYLNWEYAKTIETDQATASDNVVTSSDVITDALPTEEDLLESVDKNYGEAQLVSASVSSGSQFFEEARLARTQTRDAALEEIEKSLKKSSLSDEEKEELKLRLSSALENITTENQLETLIKAKGFADCIVTISSNGVDVNVMTEKDALTAAQVAQIRDIIISGTEFSAQDITIVEVSN